MAISPFLAFGSSCPRIETVARLSHLLVLCESGLGVSATDGFAFSQADLRREQRAADGQRRYIFSLDVVRDGLLKQTFDTRALKEPSLRSRLAVFFGDLYESRYSGWCPSQKGGCALRYSPDSNDVSTDQVETGRA